MIRGLVAELAYAADLKSVVPRTCGFESHRGYLENKMKRGHLLLLIPIVLLVAFLFSKPPQEFRVVSVNGRVVDRAVILKRSDDSVLVKDLDTNEKHLFEMPFSITPNQ